MLDLPADRINRIVNNSPEHVRQIVLDVVYLLCRKVNLSSDETREMLSQIKENRNMGYLFENMEHMDIQEERRKTQEARAELEQFRAERRRADIELEKRLKKLRAERQQAEAELEQAQAERQQAEAELEQAQLELHRKQTQLEAALKELERYHVAEKEKSKT